MDVVDIVLGLVLISGALRGFQRGLLRELISVLAFGAALIVANIYHEALATKDAGLLGGYLVALATPLIAKVVAFALIVLVVIVVAHFVGEVLHRIVGLLFLGFANRLGGLLFGLAEAALFVLIGLVVLAQLNAPLSSDLIDQSMVAAKLWPLAPLLFALLPEYLVPIPSIPRQFL